jgi:toxin-antitoxin system PIN domain toxin
MILPDVNLLLYACDAASPFHSKSASWWSSCLSGSEPVGLCSAVIFAFVRIGTSSRVFKDPLTVDEACTLVDTWMNQPMVQVLETDARDIHTALALLKAARTAGNLTTDAQLAALGSRYRAVVHTADSDFARFADVRWHNPLRA